MKMNRRRLVCAEFPAAPCDEARDSSDVSASVLSALSERWALRHSDFEVADDAVYTVGLDNNRHIFALERIAVDGHQKVIFDGRITGAAVIGETIFVVHADDGIRRFTYTDRVIAEVNREEETL